MLLQSPMYLPQKNLSFSHYAISEQQYSSIAELAVTLVVDHYNGKLAKRQFNPHCVRTGNFCHFLPPFSW